MTMFYSVVNFKISTFLLIYYSFSEVCRAYLNVTEVKISFGK